MPVKILIVDDEPKQEDLMRQLLRKEVRQGEFELSFALNGREALDKLRADPQIEIVMTDINMPQMNGLALLAELSKLKPALNPVLTAIVVSAYGDMENIRKAMNAGAFDFLTKPLDFEDVKATLAKAIAHVQRLKQALEQERLAQEALRQMNEELERRVEARTVELAKSNAELNAFAHTVAHDLKDPLGQMIGYANYLLDFYSKTEPEEALRFLQNIRQAGYDALNIIEALLLLAGVRKQEAPLEAVDMAISVNRARQRLASMIHEYQAEIILPEAWPMALGYAPWLEEVWSNYLSNALKYGGRPPRLELGATPQADGTICFWVKDNGPGLSQEAKEGLFAEFTRLNEAQMEGHGLGLSIVRRIIEKLGGRVGVESKVEQGSTFFFTLHKVV
jgi:signal transduction histidine kinase